MSEILVGLISGFIFGLGLCLSGLADPSVVQGFLDIDDAWNPALLFVIGAGLTVTLTGYRLVFGRGRPLWSPRFNPGPALVSLASGRIEVFVFVTAMVTGMIAVRWMRVSPTALPTGLGQS
jgi:uncharacterized membrane protein YedE/YeeE